MSPSIIQTALLNAYAARIHLERFGHKFEKICTELQGNEFLNYGDLLEYQNIRLRPLIKHAYETVPYYRKIMTERRLKPDDISTVDDLQKLPILTREDVRNHQRDLISKTTNRRKLVPGHTSGTTGSPLEFYWDQNMCLYNNAVDWRQKNWAGLIYGEPYAVLLGRTIVPRETNHPPFWRMNYLHKQLWLSSFHMSDDNLFHYVKKLEAYQPKALEGYPSTVYILAKYLESKGQTLPLKSVLTSSETLLPIQRETIERSFECKVFDFYGMAERVIFATECEKHEGHHLNVDYGITEVLNDAGEAVETGNPGWLVGTSLHNYAMPFIRYKTSDVSGVRKHACSCGRQFPLMDEVTTKAEDIVVTRDGRYISPSVLTHPFKPLHTIKMSQIIQEDLDSLCIKIVRGDDYSDKDTETLLSAFKDRVGPSMKVRVEFVDSLERTSGGKFKWVISKVPLKF
jgi:phenylacetate-CoA ligase